MTSLEGLLVGLLLKPGLVIAAAATIAGCLRRETAAARHAVWTGAVIATLALPVFSATLPPVRIPFLETIEARLYASSHLEPDPRVERSRAPDEKRGVPARPRWLDPPSHRLADTLLAIWILGALLFLARRIESGIRARRIVRFAQPVLDARLAAAWSAALRSAGIRRTVQIRLSADVSSPAAFGVIHPVILLPEAATTWADEDLQTALTHELAHVGRGDCLLNAIADAAAIVYWCHPVVCFATRRMRVESERACDDEVLRRGADSGGYAHLLLEVARTSRACGAVSGGAALARARELESRLLAVLDGGIKRSPIPPAIRTALTSLAILLAVPVAGLTLRPSPARAELAAPEPDLRGDALSDPRSERVALPPDGLLRRSDFTQLLAGPDSALAALMLAAREIEPRAYDDLVGARAAWTLAQGWQGRLVEPLLGALDAPDWRVRSYAAWALAYAGDSRAVLRLIPCLRHPVWRLRAMAAFALRELRDPRAEPAMVAALTDPAWQVRVEAVGYLSALGGPELASRIRPRLDDRHLAVRRAAALALATL
jgi:beta-lactamase regulating signal transducer with metallopeptidase domain